MASNKFNDAYAAAIDAAARSRHAQQVRGMSAYDRHKRLVHDLINYYGAKPPPSADSPAAAVPAGIKSDLDILKDSHRFIRSKDDDAEQSWKVRLAKRYYSRLFKEYALADLSRYKEGKLGLRWRTHKEVVQGKGQFMCGSTGCDERRGLTSFEVPFGYSEAGQRKQALVKVRVCPTHAYQLNYKKHQEAEKAEEEKARKKVERKKKDRKKKKRDRSKSPRRKRRGGEKIEEESHGSSSSDDEEDSSEDRRKRRKRRKESKEGSSSDEERHRRKEAGDDFERFFDGLFE